MKRLKIRSISTLNMFVAVLVGVLFFYISYAGGREFQVLEAAAEQCIICENAAKNVQDGSDYLTEQVRLYAMTGQQEYMDAYFNEANVVCRRENALELLRQNFDDSDAFKALQMALDCSQKLMNTEYYSMRLVSEAEDINIVNWPDEVLAVELSENDAMLPANEKLLLAQKLVCDDAYQSARTEITSKVTECMNELIEQTKSKQKEATSIFSDTYNKLELGILILVAMMLAMCIIVRRLIVVPLIKYNNSIRNGETFEVCGAEELQILAETYNQVYTENQDAQLLVQHKAEHDALTDLLNRGSFDKLLHIYENNENRYALIIVDIDSFKSINDTYGHAEGDAVLKKVANLLLNAFRSVDYVFRIGGDEFAIIMVEMTSSLKYTITDKIESINRVLTNPTDSVPKVSISAGTAFSDRENPSGSIFDDADHALYQCKSNGKAGCCFYGEQ